MSTSSTKTRHAKGPPSAESGLTIVEALIAVAVLAVGAFSTLTTLTSSSALDENLKERSLALRAVMSRMESVMAYDYDDDIDNLVNFWTQPANSTFAVEGLAGPAKNVDGGSVAVNTADPERIVVTVRVDWTSRSGEAKSLAIQHVMTEVIE
jgi:Tfp pilus assembly protein PilV